MGINLGDNSQLTPMNIYYSIASILRDEMTKSRGWERFLKFTVAPRTIGTVAFTFLAATAPMILKRLSEQLDGVNLARYLHDETSETHDKLMQILKNRSQPQSSNETASDANNLP